MILVLFLLLLFQFPFSGFGQENVRRELDFVQHLISRNELRESLFLLHRIHPDDQNLTDSVNFLRGWVLYQQKQLDTSAFFLLKVFAESPLFQKSRFFAAYNLAHVGSLQQASSVMQNLSFEEESGISALKNFQMAGIALLQRDFESFSLNAINFKGQFNAFAQQEINLKGYANQLIDQPRRSPAVAGVLSAFIPGLGKVYAGKTAEGIAGFLYVGALGLTTYDFYRRLGPKNAFFILSSAVTGVFYIGNIWGSAVAARRQQIEFNHEMDQRILFDLHIPLRNFFQ